MLNYLIASIVSYLLFLLMNTFPAPVWQKSNTDAFWSEIASCDHVVQIYENDGVFVDALAGFVGGGINTGECVIVIAKTF